MPEPPGPGRRAVIGIGLSSRATAADVRRSADAALRAAGMAWADVERVATVDRLAADDRIGALGCPVAGYDAGRLAAVGGVARSPRAEAKVGTPSVAEAAALLACGPAGALVVAKQRSGGVTTAVAARR